MSADTVATRECSLPALGHRRLIEFVALLVFAVVGFLFAAPCLCVTGAIRGRFTMAFTFLVFCRLAWHVHKSTFRFKDYFLYFGFVLGFCTWAESQCSN